MPRYFDTHAHYDDKRFNADRDALLSSLREYDVELVINPGSCMKTSRAAVKLSDRYPFIYSAVGVHPHYTDEMIEDDISELRRLSKHPKVAAIGEIGLDYYRNLSPRDVQKHWFERQLQLAAELDMPVIIHDREASADTLDILKNFILRDVVYHCFAGSFEHAKVLLKRGYYLSFTGSITFKNALKSHDIIRYMPLERLMLETDAPYLTPDPHRGERNDSTFLPQIAQLMADIRGITLEELTEATFQTGKKFFRISG